MRAAGFSDGAYETVEEHFARDVEKMDVHEPDWDHSAELDAMRRLSRGMSISDAIAIFGPATVSHAYEQLARSALGRDDAEPETRIFA